MKSRRVMVSMELNTPAPLEDIKSFFLSKTAIWGEEGETWDSNPLQCQVNVIKSAKKKGKVKRGKNKTTA